MFITIVSASIILAVIGGILYYRIGLSGQALINYARTLGVISSILMILQWAPQIYTTWKLQVFMCFLAANLPLPLPFPFFFLFCFPVTRVFERPYASHSNAWSASGGLFSRISEPS
jgi:hypothetical protein